MTDEAADTSVLVVSCDKYHDLWVPFFTLFFRYWPDCPYPVYLCSNEKTHEDEGVQTLLTGPDLSWSTTLKRCLERLPTPYLILFQEDFLFTKKVDTQRVGALVSCLRNQEAACLRLYPSPPPDRPTQEDPEVGEIATGAAYRVSLQAAIWDKAVLYGLLKDGESPWDLEYAGSERSNSIPRRFLSISGGNRERWPLDYFSTAVVQGKWVREAVALCAREGIRVDETSRAIESAIEPLCRKCLAFLRALKNRVFSGSR